MGTISDKLTYLNTTKGKIKDTINLTGANILSEDTFRSYADKLKQGLVDAINDGGSTIYSNFPKTTGTGTEIALNGTYEAPMEIGLKGNTEQTTYTGKNLFKSFDFTKASNGITFTYNKDGSININGTSTGNALSMFSSEAIPYLITLQPGTYTISGGIGNAYIEVVNSTGQAIGNTSTQRTFEITSATQVFIRLNIGTGFTFNNAKVYPQLEEGSTASSYEPFVGGSPSPSPDFPQPIEVVTGDNTIKVENNVFDITTITENTYINEYGGTGTSSVTNLSDYILIEPSTTYTLTYEYETLLNTSQRNVCYYDENKNFISGDMYFPTDKVYSNTTPNNAKYLRFSYDKNINNIRFITESQTYSLNLGSIELCKIVTYQDYIYKENNKWYKHSEIGKVVLDGSEGWDRYSATQKPVLYLVTENFNINYKQESGLICYCDNFKGVGQANSFDDIYDYGNNVIGFRTSYTRLVIRDDSMTTTTDFKTWLSTHNTAVYYVLATPTNTEITDTDLLEQLETIRTAKSVENKTIISQTNANLPFIISASALSKN